jgi:hypothetical protein
MRKAFLSLLIVTLAMSAIVVRASGPIAVYAIVDKVVMEPDEKAPERIQIWGAFAVETERLSGKYAPAQAGYLYYKIDPWECGPNTPNLTGDGKAAVSDCVASAERAARTIWSDLKKMAGTGEAIGFGGYFGGGSAPAKVRKATDKPQSPNSFSYDNPVVTLGAAQRHIAAGLKAALAAEKREK